jgi:hypothetical protein
MSFAETEASMVTRPPFDSGKAAAGVAAAIAMAAKAAAILLIFIAFPLFRMIASPAVL